MFLLYMNENSVEPSSEPFNLLRKLWHMLGLLPPVCIYLDVFRWFTDQDGQTKPVLLVFYLILTGIILIADYYRLTSAGFQKFYYHYLGKLMKEEEKSRINATIPYLFSNFLLFVFFSSEVAVISSIFLIFGDPAAAYFGHKFGRIRFKNKKSLEGTAGFAIVGFIFAFVFLIFHNYHTNPYDAFLLIKQGSVNFFLLILIAFGALFAAVTETLSGNSLFGLLDDNLFVPLVSAAGMSVMGYFLFDMPYSSLFTEFSLLSVF